MPRQINRLSALDVSRARKRGKRGMYADGDGLYLQISAGGATSWTYRYMLHGSRREMGLGSYPTVTLSAARLKAADARLLRGDGIDPIKARDDARAKARLEAARSITFKKAAEEYMAAHKDEWGNAKHAAQWRSTLSAYVFPIFGELPVQNVDVTLVMRAVEPIWGTKRETASRVRGRIEAVLDWASAYGFRSGENPARWRGHMKNLLAKRPKRQQVKHHPALPYGEIGAFMVGLRRQQGTAASALEFLILTTGRAGEIIGARWNEVNIGDALWTVPAERVKSGREHRVSLSPAALTIINAMQEVRATERGDGFVFPGGKRGWPLSNTALRAVLKRLRRSDVTVHGFRSTFRDWVAEQTNYAREIPEMALGHAVGNETEKAYLRTDLFERRRHLMHEWARFCDGGARAGEVVAIRDRQAKN
ncbi:MAG: integrase arm-type DNA-binding domain-containing protein [bacterium]